MLNLRNMSLLLSAMLLVGCGGGGGGGSAPPSSLVPPTTPPIINPPVVNPPVVPVVLPGLYISEVAGNFRQDKDYDAHTTKNSVAWVELYNRQDVAINLKDYLLRTGGLKASDPSQINPVVDFALPNVVIPANGYVAIAGKKSSELRDSTVLDVSKVIYIKDATNTYLPYWANDAGFIELQAVKTATIAAKTVDFVRFGSSSIAPLTAEAWTGSNVAAFALPAADYVGSQSLDPLDSHDQSIVRLSKSFTTSKTLNDWTLVKFPTSGGPNDVAANAVDSDHDGIPDSAKVAGGTFAGLDLYAMGARPGRKDMFIQVDHLAANPVTKEQEIVTVPADAALRKIVDAFTPHAIATHFDAGTLYSGVQDPTRYNLDGLSHARPFSVCTQAIEVAASCRSLLSYYTQHVDPRRRGVFRYALFGSSFENDGSSGLTGFAELPGNKLLVTLHGVLAPSLGAMGLQMRTNFQASTLMHEIGHTLGLKHGGDDYYLNYKPNYLSVMNYLYSFSGVPTSGTNSDAIERYYQDRNYLGSGVEVPNTLVPNTRYSPKSYPDSALPNGPTTDTFKVDYSNGTGASLDENALIESAYIGRGAGSSAAVFGDWNYDGVLKAGAYQFSLTGQTDEFGRPMYTVLRDFNDWAYIALVTGRNYNLAGIGESFGVSRDQARLLKRSIIQLEDRLPAQVLQRFQRASAQ